MRSTNSHRKEPLGSVFGGLNIPEIERMTVVSLFSADHLHLRDLLPLFSGGVSLEVMPSKVFCFVEAI